MRETFGAAERAPPEGDALTGISADSATPDDQTLRVTLPALRHEVHTFRRLGVPATTARTRWMFGFQRRLVRRCECEIECPNEGPLPQTSQLAATIVLLQFLHADVYRQCHDWG